MPHSHAASYEPTAATEARLRLAARILRLADGDRLFADTIRAVMWADYCAAGTPLGPTEDAMLLWWDRSLPTPAA